MTRNKMLFVALLIIFLAKVLQIIGYTKTITSVLAEKEYYSSIIVRCKGTAFLNNFNRKTYFLTIIHCKRLYFCLNQLKSASVSSLEMRKCGVLL